VSICVVLAGGPRDAVAALDADAPNKAFIPIAGRTLAARTIDALRASPLIDRIIAVAPAAAHDHPALTNADEVRADGARITDSLRSGIADLPPDELVVVAASDLPILTPVCIEEFIGLANESDPDVVYGCVEQKAHLARFPDIPHTWARLVDGTYCGAGLFALRPRVFPALETILGTTRRGAQKTRLPLPRFSAGTSSRATPCAA